MTVNDALAPVRTCRRDGDVVVTTMGAAREWMLQGTHPLDLVLVPSAMGHATSFGLGLALAQPSRRVIVCNGDGSMLMNLGALVTITAAAPPNLTLLVLDNGVYEVTGSQPTPGAPAARPDGAGVDFAALAHAAGFRSVHRFGDAGEWAAALSGILAAPGPAFVALDVLSVAGTPGPRSPGPAGERARRFIEALRG